MNFCRRKVPMKDDPLWLTILLSAKILQIKPIKLMFLSSLLTCCIMSAIELHALYINPSYCLKYGPWIMVKQYGYLSLVTMLTDLDAIDEMWQRLYRWTLNSAGPVVEKAIATEVLKHHLLLMGNLILIGTCGVLVALPNPSDEESHLILLVFKQTFPEYDATVFCLLAKAVHGPIAWGMQMTPLLIIYCEEHNYYQYEMFVEHMKNLSRDFDRYDDEELLHNPHYQMLIRRRLVFCVMRHRDFSEFANGFVIPFVKKWLPFYIASGTVLGIGLAMMVYAIYANIQNCTWLNVGIVAALNAITLTTFCRLIHAGQTVEDESDKFYPLLLETRWPSWNNTNRKMLLFMFQNSKPLKMYVFDSMAVNYKLGIGMVRSIYSVISVLLTRRLRH